MGTDLGGLNNGHLPKSGLIGIMDGGAQRGNDRVILRKTLNFTTHSDDNTKRGTPFRKHLNIVNKEPVKDGSDYVTFKKLQSKNRNYNDSKY
tara:strand:- start:2736 stop:3011 length:276 start_codon:yes stop_codon:yes gene_type:complete